MTDYTDLARAITSGLITGGSAALTTFLTIFRGVRKQVKDIEDKLGSSTDPKTGLHLTVATLEDSLRRFKRDVDDWDDHPPDWAKRLVQRAKVNSADDLSAVVDIGNRVDTRLRSFQERLAILETASTHTPNSISREEYLEDAKRRVQEVSEIREEMAAINGLLKGILIALGKNPDHR